MRLSPDELFREFATTESPFEKWQLFSHITDECVFVYLPNHKQKYLCNLQYAIFEHLNSPDTKKAEDARLLMKWLLSKKTVVNDMYEHASPPSFYQAMKEMTPEQINTVVAANKNLMLVFNPRKLTFRKEGRAKSFIKKLFNWRK